MAWDARCRRGNSVPRAGSRPGRTKWKCIETPQGATLPLRRGSLTNAFSCLRTFGISARRAKAPSLAGLRDLSQARIARQQFFCVMVPTSEKRAKHRVIMREHVGSKSPPVALRPWGSCHLRDKDGPRQHSFRPFLIVPRILRIYGTQSFSLAVRIHLLSYFAGTRGEFARVLPLLLLGAATDGPAHRRPVGTFTLQSVCPTLAS